MFNPISNNEKSFITHNIIVNNIRQDKRSLEEFRTISIKKLKENGQIEVRIGKTLIISQIFAKLICPQKDRSTEGLIYINVSYN